MVDLHLTLFNQTSISEYRTKVGHILEKVLKAFHLHVFGRFVSSVGLEVSMHLLTTSIVELFLHDDLHKGRYVLKYLSCG